MPGARERVPRRRITDAEAARSATAMHKPATGTGAGDLREHRVVLAAILPVQPKHGGELAKLGCCGLVARAPSWLMLSQSIESQRPARHCPDGDESAQAQPHARRGVNGTTDTPRRRWLPVVETSSITG